MAFEILPMAVAATGSGTNNTVQQLLNVQANAPTTVKKSSQNLVAFAKYLAIVVGVAMLFIGAAYYGLGSEREDTKRYLKKGFVVLLIVEFIASIIMFLL